MKQNEVVRIKSEYLSTDPLTKRETYDPKILRMIEEDIAEHGFRDEHPLVVRPNPKKRGYWLITCGQHRFEAGPRAGIGYFPCVKKEFQGDIEALGEAYKDNILACSVDAITEAEYFDKLGRIIMKGMGHTDASFDSLRRKYPVERIALQMGIEKKHVEHRLNLLKLPEVVKWMVRRYYMPSEKGYKLSPTIAEELYRIQNLLKMQKDAGTIGANPNNPIKIKREMMDLAVKFWREKITLHEARKVAAEIGYQGYENWRDQKVIADRKGVRCVGCGKPIPEWEVPWTPLCMECKHELIPLTGLTRPSLSNIYSKGEPKPAKGTNPVNETKPNPHLPLHELDPKHHKPKRGFLEGSK